MMRIMSSSEIIIDMIKKTKYCNTDSMKKYENMNFI